MKRILYSDDNFEVVECVEHDKVSTYVHYVPSDGEFVAVLPYKKAFGKLLFLVKRELIAGWDEHPDYCCISLPLKYQPEVSAVHAVKEACDVKLNQKSLFHLGVCTASRRCDDTFYLYAIDVTHLSERFEGEHILWVDEETLIRSNDSQLITLYARFKYMI